LPVSDIRSAAELTIPAATVEFMPGWHDIMSCVATESACASFLFWIKSAM
jgi:hypothetical protein